MTWPALIFSSDLFPEQGRLNGRRWSTQLTLRLWLKATQKRVLIYWPPTRRYWSPCVLLLLSPTGTIVFGTVH